MLPVNNIPKNRPEAGVDSWTIPKNTPGVR